MIKELFQRYSHMNWALADQAMVSAVNFLTGIMLARFLGIEEFGRFTLIWLAILFMNSIQMAMISSPMMSIGPKQSHDECSVYYRAVIFQQILFSLFTFLFLFFGIRLVAIWMPEWEIIEVALPVAVVGFFFQNQDFIRRYLFSRQKVRDAFWNDAVSYIGQIILLVIAFSVYEIKILDVFWIIAFTSAMAVGFGLTKLENKLSNNSDLKIITKRHWDFSKWSTLSTLLQWASGNLVFIFTGSILGAGAVGILKAAQNIMAVTHILFQAMENFVPVRASKIYIKHGKTALRLYKNKILLMGGGVTITFAFVVFIFSEELLGAVYGPEYSDYAYVLRWFSIIYIFMFMNFPLSAVLRAVENTKSIFYSQIISSVFVIACSYPLIQMFELKGALFSLLISYVSIMLYLYFSFSKRKGNL